jgi:hypothetical protein
MKMLVSVNHSLICVFVANWWLEEDEVVFSVCHYFALAGHQKVKQ